MYGKADPIHSVTNVQETRVETRVILRQIAGMKNAEVKLHGKKLNRKEVAAYIAQYSRTMWLAATNAGMKGIAGKLETVFFDASLENDIEPHKSAFIEENF